MGTGWGGGGGGVAIRGEVATLSTTLCYRKRLCVDLGRHICVNTNFTIIEVFVELASNNTKSSQLSLKRELD